MEYDKSRKLAKSTLKPNIKAQRGQQSIRQLQAFGAVQFFMERDYSEH